MQVHVYESTQDVPKPLDEVFAFFSRPENLQEITPDSLDFQFLTPSPIAMKEGAIIDYALKIKGVPVQWRSIISCYDPPHKFVDEQLKGPYAFWHHTHAFEPIEGGTRISDTVRYVLPFGPLGDVVHSLMVRRDVEEIFKHRHKVIAERFGSMTAA
jgi:hypothetical protein